ncbi:MAG: right-handed parallel beta-helix repeat-containing protein, partial [Parasporobacterium sp.]|nr:right-handed parallel beta-helix repeat-containing protein [Parasporobacterium sp.]
MKYYVDANAVNDGNGSAEQPFRTIQQAADIACPGDEVLVFPGIYREQVSPVNGGTEDAPIIYKSIEPLKAVISGAEEIRNWEKVEGTVWKTSVPDSLFGDYNPFTFNVSGDWFIAGRPAHTGDVFLNGKSLYEKLTLEEVMVPEVSKDSWDPDFSVYTWYAEYDAAAGITTIYANFHEYDPNAENVEISVRRTCFTPEAEGRNYITLSGFTVCMAATQWAPPTAYQEGMIAPHWSKGWIIEDCEIFESKCSGISLGKYLQPTNDNKWLKFKYKDGTQTERECICLAQTEGWTKENIGHHTVRRCHIHDCGQTGIVGHLGGVFSIIEDNHIHHINNKQNLAGAEIGGIKMHAAIDCIFRRNHIHNCTRGIWLDWQAQGTRVTQNLFYNNTLPNAFKGGPSEDNGDSPAASALGLGEDIFVEVSHGPTLIDNNILLSARSAKLATQGVALVHNLIGGSLASVSTGTDNGAPDMPSPRYTPYHMPHRTEVAGFMTFLHGDMKIYNNIFVQQWVPASLRKLEQIMSSDGNPWEDGCMTVGNHVFDDYETFETWDKDFEGYCGMGSPSSNRYYKKLPVWTGGNVFFNGAKPWNKEENYIEDKEHVIKFKVVCGSEAQGAEGIDPGFGMFIKTDLGKYMPAAAADILTSDDLGMAFEPEQRYENPDGSTIVFDEDFSGNSRTGR